LELLFDQEKSFDALVTDFLQSTAQQTAATQAQIGTVDAATVSPYMGRYSNPDLGDVTLSLRDGKLILDAGEVRAELRPYKDGTGAETMYVAVDAPLAGTTGITFSNGTGGNTLTLTDLLTGEMYEFTAGTASANRSPSG
jgi:hypothetical protein